MANELLNTRSKILTPSSGTTVYIDYSARKKILEVEFVNGQIYHYHEVESVVWEEYQIIIKSGGSSGIYVNTKIKPRYKYLRIR